MPAVVYPIHREFAMNVMIVMVAIAWQATTGAVDDPGRAGRLVLVAGGGTGGDGASADRAKLVSPFGVGFDAEGTLFFVEMTGHKVRKIGPDGLVVTVAGSGQVGSGGDDGPAARAELNGPHSLAVAGNGDVFVTDTWNNRVRKIDARSGRITTIAGTGRQGVLRGWRAGHPGRIRRDLLPRPRRGRADDGPGGPR